MNAGYIYMLLGLLSYSTLGVLHKLADVKDCRPAGINVLLYAFSLIYLSAATVIIGHAFHVPLNVALLALPFGIASAIAILALQTALRFGNISTSWLAINLSAGVPTVASIVLYREPVSLRKGFSLVLITLAMLLLWKDRKMEESGAYAKTPAPSES